MPVRPSIGFQRGRSSCTRACTVPAEYPPTRRLNARNQVVSIAKPKLDDRPPLLVHGPFPLSPTRVGPRLDPRSMARVVCPSQTVLAQEASYPIICLTNDRPQRHPPWPGTQPLAPDPGRLREPRRARGECLIDCAARDLLSGLQSTELTPETVASERDSYAARRIAVCRWLTRGRCTPTTKGVEDT